MNATAFHDTRQCIIQKNLLNINKPCFVKLIELLASIEKLTTHIEWAREDLDFLSHSIWYKNIDICIIIILHLKCQAAAAPNNIVEWDAIFGAKEYRSHSISTQHHLRNEKRARHLLWTGSKHVYRKRGCASTLGRYVIGRHSKTIPYALWKAVAGRGWASGLTGRSITQCWW